MYKIMNDTQILRISDGAIIPVCEKNSDYQFYLEWIAEGNIAEIIPPIIPPPQTVFSKLDIVEAFDSINQTAVLNALLDHESFKLYWISANEIDMNHPITATAITSLNADDSNDLTAETIIDIITGGESEE